MNQERAMPYDYIPDSPSFRIKYAQNVNFYPHFHHWFEFVLVVTGCIFMEVKGKEYIIRQGEGIWIETFSMHSFRTPEQSGCYIMEISANHLEDFKEWVEDHDCESPHICFRPYAFKYLVSKLPLEKTSLNKNEGYRYIDQPLEACKRLYFEITSIEFIEGCVWSDKKRRPDNVLLSVLEFMEKNYSHPITLESTAENFGIRPETLARKFRQINSGTFLDHLQRLRVFHACIILKEGKSVIDATFATGFGSVCSFNRVFRKYTGFSPSEYKKLG